MKTTLPITQRAPGIFCALWLAIMAGVAFGADGKGADGNVADESDATGTQRTFASDATGRIVIQTIPDLPKPPDFYTGKATADVLVRTDRITQRIVLDVKIIQGEPERLTFGFSGDGQVTDVRGDAIKSWAIRQVGESRFLDLHPGKDARELSATIKVRSARTTLPATVNLTHLTPGDAVGFSSVVNVRYTTGVEGRATAVEGFTPLGGGDRPSQFQTTTGGSIRLRLARDGAAPGPVELSDTSLSGELHPNGQSMRFQLRGTAHVRDANAELIVLSGNAATDRVPARDAKYRLHLETEHGHPVYKFVFPAPGTFPLSLDFVAPLSSPEAGWQSMDFTVAAGAVVPVTLKGLADNLEFRRAKQTVVPLRDGSEWVGFLPASGRARLQWKTARRATGGKLFFATTAQVEVRVGAGLLRQEHVIDYQILQGQVDAIRVRLSGPGEIIDVQGQNILAWKVTGDGEQRQLEATLSQPIRAASQIRIRSQTPLGAFPVRVEGLRAEPVGAIRHSGHLRLTNAGAVRLDPSGLRGLTQLAPDQFPGNKSDASQVFVYRFPAADHQFSIAADRIQAEVNISQLILYELSETDRVIRADVELDIREAPVRQWDFGIPDDYSVVAVSGAGVADHLTSTESVDGQRNLKVIFQEDVTGRQLVSLQLEKNQQANAGDWSLPRIEHPNAKTVRGDIGIVGAPGLRVAVKETHLLVEKPLSYFPKPLPNLQQAFRIREPAWSATMSVERLERSVQADVFHLYSLSQQTIYGSALINYFVTGAPISEWKVNVPQSLGNVVVDGQDVRTWRRDGDTLLVTLHQPVMGAYTLLVTFEEKPQSGQGSFQAGQVEPLDVNGERGFIQVSSPMQVEVNTLAASDGLLLLEPIELPAEFRLLSAAPPLGTWQYTERPLNLNLQVNWFQPGTTVPQVVEFSEATSRVSQDGELVTEILYYVKSRGQRSLKIELPRDPVRLWEASVNNQPVTARQTDEATLIPLPGGVDPNAPVEVRLRLGKPSSSASHTRLTLPIVHAPVLKTQWSIQGDQQRILIPARGTVAPEEPVLRPSGLAWVAERGLPALLAIGLLAITGTWATRKSVEWRPIGLVGIATSVVVACFTANLAFSQMGSSTPLALNLPILASGQLVEIQVKNTPLWLANYSWQGIAIALAGVSAILWSYLMNLVQPHVPQLKTESTSGEQQQEVASKAAPSGQPQLLLRAVGLFLLGFGVLLHRDGAPTFFGLLALVIFFLAFLPPALALLSQARAYLRTVSATHRDSKATEESEDAADEEPGSGGAVVTTILLVGLLLGNPSKSAAATPEGLEAADAIQQHWRIAHGEGRLSANGSLKLTGKPGDRFLLLRAPAVLTRFEGHGLRLTKSEIAGIGLAYVVSIPVAAERNPEHENGGGGTAEWPDAAGIMATEHTATFDFQLEALNPRSGIPVLTDWQRCRSWTYYLTSPAGR